MESLKPKPWLKLLGFLSAIFSCAAFSQAAGLDAEHHIQIELFPAEMRLVGQDAITIKASGSEVLEFRLSELATQIKVQVNGDPRNFTFKNGRLQLNLQVGEKFGKVKVTILYSAKFDDPVPARPVNMDNPGFGVSATISQKGSFLLAGAGWYPELVDSRSTYRVTVTAPSGLIAVTAGRSLGHKHKRGQTISTWEVTYPVEGLALSVAPYLVEEKTVGNVTAATYLLPQNRALAASYLEAIERYLKLYSELFGPYPFQKFAVVENFFPTGFGFPSFTLLGGRVLRLPFVIHTSLGHEIAHCWWGNGVYVDYARGNWGEGLTSYVADYRFKEMTSPKAALGHRRQWLRNYSTLVTPENDFALEQFQSRYDPITRTIGYDKGAMVFHMIRQTLGDEAFWGALRDIYRSRLFKRSSWSDLQHAFESRGGESLQNFFDQWVYRRGAPQFSLDGIRAESTGGTWKVKGQIIQSRPYFNCPLVLKLDTREQTILKKIDVSGKTTVFELNCDLPPQKLTADPDNDIFRRLDPSEIPPAVNTLKSSLSVVTVLSQSLEPEIIKVAETLVLSLGLKDNRFVTENELNRQMLAHNDILLIGRPRRNDLLQRLPGRISIQPKSFSVNERLYDRPADTFFGVFEHPDITHRITALFMPLSTQNADRVARKITHYGKYSYLVFNSGKNAVKGSWPVETSPLVYKWNYPAGDPDNS
jgi:Peptidase family M1 domain